MKKIAILGGGITGLVSAFRLSQKGFKVEVFEKEKVLGGLARSFNYKNYKIPISPHQFFSDDFNIINLLKELNLKPYWGNASIALFSAKDQRKKVYPLLKPIDLLKLPLLSFKDRLILGIFSFRLLVDKFLKIKYDYLDKINAKEWLIKQTNYKIYSTFFEPLLINKFAVPLEKLSAAWLAMQLRETIGKGSKSGYVEGGFHILIDRLRREILKRKGSIHLYSEVIMLKQKNNKIISLKYKKEGKIKEMKVDYVLSTFAPSILANITSFPKEYSDKIKRIEYAPYIGGIMIYRKNITKEHITYMLNSSIGALNEFSNFYKKMPFKIMYFFKYTNINDRIWKMPKSKIKKIFISSIKEICPNIEYDDFFVFKERYSSPIYEKNYLQYQPKIETPLSNLYMAGMFNIHPKMRNIDSAVFAGEKAAKIIEKI
ncbi:MAG: FAD-dependent oxidoreductase [Candidatus Pacearchaeota archaeon]